MASNQPVALAAAAPGGGVLSVSVCFATPEHVWLVTLALKTGATVGTALAASGFAHTIPGLDLASAHTGVFGKRVGRTHRLTDGDRVEIYRPLTFDPKDSRRRRAQHRQRLRAVRSAVVTDTTLAP